MRYDGDRVVLREGVHEVVEEALRPFSLVYCEFWKVRGEEGRSV